MAKGVCPCSSSPAVPANPSLLNCPPVKGKQVRLATDTPKHLPVVREELLEREEGRTTA